MSKRNKETKLTFSDAIKIREGATHLLFDAEHQMMHQYGLTAYEARKLMKIAAREFIEYDNNYNL